MRYLTLAAALAAATPAMAAKGPFFSLANTDFVVLVSFLLFIGILVYFKLPAKLGALLDARAARIKAELDEAQALREEAKTILASYERKKKEVQEQADRIVANARDEALRAAAEAKEELQRSIARRVAAATDRIAAAEKEAVREVREKAITVAIAAAGDMLAGQMTAQAAQASVNAAITEVGARLH